MRPLILAALALAIPLAHAEPPPGADPNSPEAAWYRSLTQPGTHDGCCSIADCRPVEFHIKDGKYQALITADVFFPNRVRTEPPPIKDGWYDVPPGAVIRGPNPTGRAVACWFAGKILCFAMPELS